MGKHGDHLILSVPVVQLAKHDANNAQGGSQGGLNPGSEFQGGTERVPVQNVEDHSSHPLPTKH